MPRNVFRNGASLHRVLESAPIGHLKEFLCQADENFIPVGETVGPILAGGDDGPEFRKLILNAINELPMDHAEPVEVECRRILELSETKGPTSLSVASRMIAR